MRQHQRLRLAGVEIRFVSVGQLAKRGAGLVQERLPAELFHPAVEPLRLQPLLAVVVEGILDAVAVEPAARLLHRIAVGNAIKGDRHETVLEIRPAGSVAIGPGDVDAGAACRCGLPLPVATAP